MKVFRKHRWLAPLVAVVSATVLLLLVRRAVRRAIDARDDAFIISLTSLHERTRRSAQSRLGELSEPTWLRSQSRAALLCRHPDPATRVRGVVAQSVLIMRPHAHRLLVEQLARRDPQPVVRFTATHVLPAISGRRAAAVLSDALTDENRLVRWTAARGLGLQPLGDLLPIAWSHLPMDGDRGALLELMTQSSLTTEHVRHWRLLARSTVPVDRRIALRVLAMQGPAESGLARAALQDPEPTVRAAACVALGESGAADAAESLARAAHDRDGRVRANALRSLGLLRSERALELCRQRLQSGKAAIVAPAPVRRVTPPVFSFFDQRGQRIGIPLPLGLEQFQSSTTLDWEGIQERDDRFGAAVGLVLCGAPEAEPVLAALSSDKNSRVREVVSLGLGAVGNPATMEAALLDERRSLSSRYAALRWMAARDLHQHVAAILRTSSLLLKKGADSAEESNLLAELLRLLGRARALEAEPVLKEAVLHPLAEVRIAAVRSLAALRTDSARAAVEDVARNDYDRTVADVANRELELIVPRRRRRMVGS